MSDGFTEKTGKVILLDYAALSQRYEDREPVCLNDRERTLLIGQLQYGQWRKRWVNNDGALTDAEWDVARGWVDSLIARLMGDDECLSGNECTDYPPFSSMIDIQPGNPFVDPDYIPPGWAYPPFWVYSTPDPLWEAAGAQPGDMITDITRFPGGGFPPAPIVGGMARFRVTVRGGDELEIHLLGFPTAGYVWIQKNDNPLTLETYDLNVDVVNIPPEIGEVTIWQWDVEGDPAVDQWVDVTFIPSFGDEVIPFRYGGGLRKITICREVENGGACVGVTNVWQDEVSPCQLWLEDENGQRQFANLRLCPPLMRQGANGTEVSTDGGETWTPVDVAPSEARDPEAVNNRCLAAANAVNVFVSLHYEVCNSYGTTGITVVSLAAVIVGFIILLLGGFIAATFFIGLVSALLAYAGALTIAAFTSEVQEEFKCILYCNSSENTPGVVTFDFDAVVAEVQNRSGIADIWNVLEIYLNILNTYQGGGEGLNRAGATTAITSAECDCPDCPDGFCYYFDFAAGQQEWAAVANPNLVTTFSGGAWIAGVDSPNSTKYLTIRRYFASRSITSLQVTFSIVRDTDHPTYNYGFFQVRTGNTVNYQANFDVSVNRTGYTQVFDLPEGGISGDNILVGMACGAFAPYGDASVSAVLVEGLDINPFGVDNC